MWQPANYPPPLNPPQQALRGAATIAFATDTTIQPLSIASTASVGTPSLLNPSITLQVFINGVSYYWKESTATITKTLSSAWSCSFEVDYDPNLRAQSVTNSPIPNPGDEVALFVSGSKRFGGIVQTVRERAIKGTYRSGVAVGPSRLTIECSGYSSYLDRVIVAGLYTPTMGGPPGILVYVLWQTYLQANFGLTKNGDAGPSLVLGDQLFHYITMTEAMNRIKDQSPGWDYWVTDDKEFVYASTDPGAGATAPFTLRDGDRNHDEIEVSRSNTRFRNKQWVLPSQDLLSLRTDSATATAGQVNFVTQYVLTETPIIRVDGVDQAVTTLGAWDGSPWYYIPDGIGAFRSPGAPALAGGEIVDIVYRNSFPLAFSAQDDASIAAKGLYESIYQGKNITSADTAQQMAQTLLDLYGTDGDFPQEVNFEYNSLDQSAWLTPGMVIDVNVTFPTALANYTVEQITSQEHDGKPGVWRHQVVLRAGQGDVTEELAKQEFRTAARVGISSPPVRAEWSLYKDLPGITNPGATTGAVAEFIAIQVAGILDSWTLQSLTDPPTGASLIIDAFLNGTSIFATGNANKAVLPAGQITQASGIKFVSDNLAVAPGDVLTLYTVQVGSVNAGKNVKFAINIRSGQAV